MNYVKRNFSAPKSIALGAPEASLQQPRRWMISYTAVGPLAKIFDVLIIISMSLLSGAAYHLEAFGRSGNIEQFAGFAVVFAALFIALGKITNVYTLTELLNFKSQVRRLAIIWFAVFVFLTTVGFLMKVGESFSRGATLTFAISGLATLIASRVLWRIFLADGLAVRRFSGRKVVVISEQSPVGDLGTVETLARHGLQIANHFVLPARHNVEKAWKEVIAQAISSVRGSDVEEIVVSTTLDHWPELTRVLSELRVLPLPVNLIPVGPMSELFTLSSHTIGDTVTIELQRGPRTWSERAVKRIFDFLVAGAGLVLLLPLFLITAVAIKLDSSGPVIFRQRRCGFNGRQFQIFKFRTMSVLEDGESVVTAKPNDTRVTRVGDWLRRTSIDELPQLLNVLQGNMSIVGPRPHAVLHDDEFDKLVGNYAYRQHVKPGLTGWAQVNGVRGGMQTVVDVEKRINLDLWYIDNWSLALDFKIIFMTMFEVLRGRNAY